MRPGPLRKGTESQSLRSAEMFKRTFRTVSPDATSWALLVAMLVSFILAQQHYDFTVDLVRAVPAIVALAALGMAFWVGKRRNRARLAVGALAFLQMTLFTLLGVVLAYAFAANAGPLWDARLAAADRAIGFDWPFVLALLDRSPPAIWLLGVAYHSLTLQMIVVIVALSGASRFDTLRTTVCAAILSGFVTILISAFTPAMGNLYDPNHYHQLWPSIAWLERGLMGIVSFPSFHATLAAIFIWALRALPRLAWPGGVWATLTIIATPVFGGHYAVDVIMGLLLAPPAILVAHWLTRRQQYHNAAAIHAIA
jgi:membrane-associated phospholipid phosphatase